MLQVGLDTELLLWLVSSLEINCPPNYKFFFFSMNSEYREKACALLQEMEAYDILPDTVACSALMRVFNKGGEPSKVLILAEFMREKEIPFNDAIFYEMVAACSL